MRFRSRIFTIASSSVFAIQCASFPGVRLPSSSRQRVSLCIAFQIQILDVIILLLWLVALAFQQRLMAPIADGLTGIGIPLEDRCDRCAVAINAFGKTLGMVGGVIIDIADGFEIAHTALSLLTTLSARCGSSPTGHLPG